MFLQIFIFLKFEIPVLRREKWQKMLKFKTKFKNINLESYEGANVKSDTLIPKNIVYIPLQVINSAWWWHSYTYFVRSTSHTKVLSQITISR